MKQVWSCGARLWIKPTSMRISAWNMRLDKMNWYPVLISFLHPLDYFASLELWELLVRWQLSEEPSCFISNEKWPGRLSWTVSQLSRAQAPWLSMPCLVCRLFATASPRQLLHSHIAIKTHKNRAGKLEGCKAKGDHLSALRHRKEFWVASVGANINNFVWQNEWMAQW